jgi:PhnB protein
VDRGPRQESIIDRSVTEMSTAHKPQGYNAVSPYLIVDGAEATIRFLSRVLGAVELRRFADPAGRIVHAEVRIDDSVLMIADSVPDWPSIGAHVHVYVPDVDATYRAALEAGATSVQPPAKKDDEDRRGGVRDPGGTTWWIATRVE